MHKSRILEVSVESAEAAAAAERGGADRIELCAEAAIGGVTPSKALMAATRTGVQVPIVAMIRPRGGGFVYSEEEIAAMRAALEVARECQMDGVVLGLLLRDGEIDVERSKELVERAAPLPVTFHRAFDECADLRRGLEQVIRSGAATLLTSGGRPTAVEGAAVLRELVRTAGDRITVLPGSGIYAGNIRQMVRETGAREFHAALSSVVKRPAENLKAFEDEVRKLSEALASCANRQNK